MLDLTKAEHLFDNRVFRLKDRGFIIDFQLSNDISHDYTQKPKPEWWIYDIEVVFDNKPLKFPSGVYPRSISGGMTLEKAQSIVNDNVTTFLKHYFKDLL